MKIGTTRLRALSLALLLAVGGAGQAPTTSAPALEIRALDVGQGDAFLLRSGGRVALIDAGPSDAITRRLRTLGVDTVDLFVASHNHFDHIGGADAVLDSFPVRFYLDNGRPAGTRIQQRVLERVERKRVTYLRPERRTLSLGTARIRVIPAPSGATGNEQNNRSLVVLVEQGAFRALLTGDSETEELNALLARESIPDVDLLKAAHHGSRDGLTPAWLAHTRPEVVIISAGAANQYEHPHASALRYYCASNRAVWRTDRHGEITVSVDAAGSYRVAGRKRAASGC